MQRAEVKMLGAADALPGRIDARAVLIAHGCAERGQRAGTPIGARAASDADDDVAASVLERLRNHRPEAMAEAVIGAGTPPGSRCRPQISAISTTAVSPLRAYAVCTTWPVGPLA